MATMTKPSLAIDLSLPNNKAKVTVNTTLSYSTFDLNSMKIGMRYRISCKIMGEDVFYDDNLYVFPSKTLSGNRKNTETITFSTTLNKKILDEDDSIFDDTDEVYASVSLINLDIQSNAITKKSNVIVHKF